MPTARCARSELFARRLFVGIGLFAVTATNTSGGSWWYSTNNGGSFTPMGYFQSDLSGSIHPSGFVILENLSAAGCFAMFEA